MHSSIRYFCADKRSLVLAVQNMEATNKVEHGQEIEFAALQGSLSMMSKVLNDVLDL